MTSVRTQKLLRDLQRSCEYILDDIDGRTEEDYLADRRLRQVVERNLEIIGEVINRLERENPLILRRITDSRQIVGLCNRLAHGYDVEINDQLVWEAIQDSIPTLNREARELLEELISDE
jgi:uncharacterized protein with HEPN domain